MHYTILISILVGIALAFSHPAYSQTFESRSYAPGTQPASLEDTDAANTILASSGNDLTGGISLRVFIDRSGRVSDATWLEGPGFICSSATHPDVVAVRAAAERAARLLTFAPARIAGEPIDSEGVVYLDIPNPVEGDSFPPKESGSLYRDVQAARGQPYTIGHMAPGSTAINIVKPVYPAAARAVGASGAVSIKVLVETDGSVFSAEPISGHPLLRLASRKAACESKFTPTLLSGTPVRVLSLINYDFKL